MEDLSEIMFLSLFLGFIQNKLSKTQKKFHEKFSTQKLSESEFSQKLIFRRKFSTNRNMTSDMVVLQFFFKQNRHPDMFTIRYILFFISSYKFFIQGSTNFMSLN